MYLIPVLGGSPDTGSSGATQDLADGAPSQASASAFANDVANQICVMYDACGYLVLYDDDLALCVSEVSSEYFAIATEDSCSFNEDLAAGCVAYVDTLTCNEVDGFRAGETICDTICG